MLVTPGEIKYLIEFDTFGMQTEVAQKIQLLQTAVLIWTHAGSVYQNIPGMCLSVGANLSSAQTQEH